jgi:cytidylate kinase
MTPAQQFTTAAVLALCVGYATWPLANRLAAWVADAAELAWLAVLENHDYAKARRMAKRDGIAADVEAE